MDAMSRYHIIQGKPAKAAAAIQADYQASGGKIEVVRRDEKAAEAIFTHPASPKPVTVTWTIEQATAAGLTNKQTWRQYPRQMLWARVVSEGVRATYPAATGLLYTPEEVGDFTEDPKPVNVEIMQETRQPQAPQTPPEKIAPPVITPHAEHDPQLISEVTSCIKRLMQEDYDKFKDFTDRAIARNPTEALERCTKAYGIGKQYFSRYIHAAKRESGISEEKYRNILGNYDLLHATECLTIQDADSIVEDIKRESGIDNEPAI